MKTQYNYNYLKKLNNIHFSRRINLPLEYYYKSRQI